MVTFQQSYLEVTNAVMMIIDRCSVVILSATYLQLILGNHNVNKASELLLGYPCHHDTSFTTYLKLSSVLLNYYFEEVM